MVSLAPKWFKQNSKQKVSATDCDHSKTWDVSVDGNIQDVASINHVDKRFIRHTACHLLHRMFSWFVAMSIKSYGYFLTLERISLSVAAMLKRMILSSKTSIAIHGPNLHGHGQLKFEKSLFFNFKFYFGTYGEMIGDFSPCSQRCQAKQYFLTLQVSRYCLLAPHGNATDLDHVKIMG